MDEETTLGSASANSHGRGVVASSREKGCSIHLDPRSPTCYAPRGGYPPQSRPPGPNITYSCYDGLTYSIAIRNSTLQHTRVLLYAIELVYYCTH